MSYGRVVIPIGIRNCFHIVEKDLLEIYVVDDKIILRKVIEENYIGVVRPVDELGRVVIPIEIRKRFDIVEKDLIGIYVEKDTIIMKKIIPECTFCSNKEDLIQYKEKDICEMCLKEIQKLEYRKEEKVI